MKNKLDNALAILKPKLKSKVVWAAAGAWVIRFLFSLQLIDAPDQALAVYDSALSIMTAVGILNNPNDRVNW